MTLCIIPSNFRRIAKILRIRAGTSLETERQTPGQTDRQPDVATDGRTDAWNDDNTRQRRWGGADSVRGEQLYKFKFGKGILHMGKPAQM